MKNVNSTPACMDDYEKTNSTLACFIFLFIYLGVHSKIKFIGIYFLEYIDIYKLSYNQIKK